MASCESNLYPNVSFSSRQRVKAVPIVTLVRSLALSASLFLFFALSDIVFFCFFGAFSMMNTDETSAMAEAQIAILKVIVAAQFFSSCYFKVQLLHTVTLRLCLTLGNNITL